MEGGTLKKLFKLVLIISLLYQATAFTTIFLAAAQADEIPSLSTNQSLSIRHGDESDELNILFINVGKADAILLRYNGKAFLIDTGSKDSLPSLFGALNLFDIKKLDGVFLTHTHSDHVGGMEALARYYGVGELYSAVFSENKKNGKNKIEELAQELSLSHRKLRAGERVTIAEDVYIDVLGPIVFDAEDDNDNSLVLKLHAHDRIFLFVGDMQFRGEDALLQSGADLNADVLKVGNHGNPDATSEQFAAAVSPDYSVISTDSTEDPNSANERVLNALRMSNIYVTENFACGALFQVYTDGTIEVTDPKLPNVPSNVLIAGVQRDTQTVTLTNKGTDTDVSGFMILSQRGSELFVFPDGSLLHSGQSITVSSKPGADYTWPDESKVWHQEKEDSALLYDRFGSFLTRWD